MFTLFWAIFYTRKLHHILHVWFLFFFGKIGVHFLQNITRKIDPMFYLAAEANLQY